MDSKESAGLISGQVAIICTRVLDIAIQKGVEAGIEAAEARAAEKDKTRHKDRYNRRLHNTRLLLKNYRSLKRHALSAVYTGSRANEAIRENAIDILDSLDYEMVDDHLYIESIKRSQQRTRIIIEHIDEMLRYWCIDCQESGKPENMRRYRIVYDTYIREEYTAAEELAERENIEKRTVYKDIGAAMRPLSALIFGIDGINQD